jgi:hypothetical protein
LEAGSGSALIKNWIQIPDPHLSQNAGALEAQKWSRGDSKWRRGGGSEGQWLYFFYHLDEEQHPDSKSWIRIRLKVMRLCNPAFNVLL